MSIKIETIILGNHKYQDKAGTLSNLTVAITLNDSINIADLQLRLFKKDGSGSYKEEPHIISAINADSEKKKTNYGEYVHFNIENLNCNEEYAYEIVHNKGEILAIPPAFGEVKKPTPLTRIYFKAPPAKEAKVDQHFIFSGDQEAVELTEFLKGESVKSPEVEKKETSHHVKKLVKKLHHKISDLLDIDQRIITTQIYKKINEANPDVFIHLADIFHGEIILSVHGERRQVTELERFRKSIREDFHSTTRDTLAGIESYRVLDDHDLGKNSANASHYQQNQDAFHNALAAFNEFWPVPENPEDNNRGLYYQVSRGEIDIWFLHNRLYSENEKGYSTLGRQQYTWLEKTLIASKANIKFIVTPLPFVMGKNPSEDYRKDPIEWNNLLQLFAKSGVNAIFCADSHNYSRSELVIDTGDLSVTIPQFLVGMLGGKYQKITKEERELLEKASLALLPTELEDKEQYKNTSVKSYYTPHPCPSLQKKYRAFVTEEGSSSGKWRGEKYRSRQFGFMSAKIQYSKDNPSTAHLVTNFFAFADSRKNETSKKHKKSFTDAAEYTITLRK